MDASVSLGVNCKWNMMSRESREATLRAVIGEVQEDRAVPRRLSELAEAALADCREFVLRGGLLNMDAWIGAAGIESRVCTACFAGAWLTVSHPGQALETMTIAGGVSNLPLGLSRTMRALDLLRVGCVLDAFVAWQGTGYSDQAQLCTLDAVEEIGRRFRALGNLEELSGFINLEELAVMRPAIEGLKGIESYVDGLA